jgi:hypothetical protein
MELSDTQIEQIRARIQSAGITRNDLVEDLLDHLCCLVEEEMHSVTFEIALDRVWGGFAPVGGLHSIQREINFMFNDKISNMKKIIFFATASVLGLFFLAMFFQGLRLINNYEWRFLEDLAFVTQYLICLLFLPLYWHHHYTLAIAHTDGLANTTKGIMFLIGFLCSEALINAIFFKLMHMPGGNQLFVAAASLGLIYVPFYTVRKYRLIF